MGVSEVLKFTLGKINCHSSLMLLAGTTLSKISTAAKVVWCAQKSKSIKMKPYDYLRLLVGSACSNEAQCANWDTLGIDCIS